MGQAAYSRRRCSPCEQAALGLIPETARKESQVVTHSRDRAAPESLSREEMLTRAGGLVPNLRERAEHSEHIRQCPAETITDFIESGLLVAGNPPRFGGYETDYVVTQDILMQLGRGDGSQAWCYAVWTVLNWAVGHFPEQAQEEYFATGPQTLCSSSFDPSKGRATPVPGGYRPTDTGTSPAAATLLPGSCPVLWDRTARSGSCCPRVITRSSIRGSSRVSPAAAARTS